MCEGGLWNFVVLSSLQIEFWIPTLGVCIVYFSEKKGGPSFSAHILKMPAKLFL